MVRCRVDFIPLPENFFLPSARIVAPLLLGHWLLRRTPTGVCGGPIVEVEAYVNDDPACHAFAGETPRNRSMWSAPGTSYVYLIYGYHFCINAVCCSPGIAEAILIRAIEPALGEKFLRAQRPVLKDNDLTNGPAKLCAAMKIDRTLDGINLCDERSPLFIAQNPKLELFRKERGPVVQTTRIGISKAVELPLRFYLEGSPFISRRIAGQTLRERKRKTLPR
ncbi:MAG: DNA-3-methyladenine glycosylase [Verrucomicrobiota bacterium]